MSVKAAYELREYSFSSTVDKFTQPTYPHEPNCSLLAAPEAGSAATRTADEHGELGGILAVLVLHHHLVVALVARLGLPDAEHDGAHVAAGDELVAAALTDLLDALRVSGSLAELFMSEQSVMLFIDTPIVRSYEDRTKSVLVKTHFWYTCSCIFSAHVEFQTKVTQRSPPPPPSQPVAVGAEPARRVLKNRLIFNETQSNYVP